MYLIKMKYAVNIRITGEHPNFEKIKFVVGASSSLVQLGEDAPTTKKINLHIWDTPDSRGSLFDSITIDNIHILHH